MGRQRMLERASEKSLGSRHTDQNGRPSTSTSTKQLTGETNPRGFSRDSSKTRLLLTLLHCVFHSDLWIAGHLTAKESSSVGPQPSPFYTSTPPLPDWPPGMNESTLDYISKRQDSTSKFMGVNKISSEGIINEYGGVPVSSLESLDITDCV